MSVVMMYSHMSSGGPFLPGYRQDDAKDLPLARCVSGVSVDLPCSKRTTGLNVLNPGEDSVTQHFFIAASPECARYC